VLCGYNGAARRDSVVGRLDTSEVDSVENQKSLRIEIRGHTDDIGQRSDNMALSNDRANKVMQYLKVLGVASNRMSANGFGPDKPIADNSSEEGRAKNRRTEFVVLSF
ncbi:MAG: OmpA family protein, partial [Bacteroidota bacterium]